MKILSFNCRGLAGPLKRNSFYRLVELNQPDIMLLYETMGEEAVIIPVFSLYSELGSLWDHMPKGALEI
jgi:exonuclease III